MKTTPAPLTGFSGRALEAAMARLAALQAHVAEVSSQYDEREDVPGTKTALVAMNFVLDDTRRNLIEEARAVALADGNAAQTRLTGRIGVILGALERSLLLLLRDAERVHARDMEAVMAPMTRVVRQIDPSSETILVPASRYHVKLNILDSLVQSAGMERRQLEAALRALPTLITIEYPAHLASDTLLHSVLAHEVAHVALARPLPGQSLGQGDRIINASITKHEALFRSGPRTSDGVQAPLLESQARQRVKRWFLELACDQVAVALVGPSFPFALFEVEGPKGRWSQESTSGAGYDTHPGLAWRLLRAVGAAERWLPKGGGHPVWAAAERAFAQLRAMIPAPADELDPIERTIITGALDELTPEMVADLVRVAGIEVGRLRQELPVVWEKLIAGIPPSEWVFGRSAQGGVPDASGLARWSRAIDWRSIMAGAYIYWLDGAPRSDLPDDTPPQVVPSFTVQDWRAFNEFVRGSIELSELQRGLTEARDSLNELNPGHR